MKKVVVSFLGKDGPGVVHAVSSLLTELNCDIHEVSQTILHSEFAAIVIAQMPDGCTVENLQKKLEKGLAERQVDLSVTARLYDGRSWSAEDPQPFVVTVDGPDQQGLISSITGVLSEYNVNIANLKAIVPEDQPDGHALIVFEVTVPGAVEIAALRNDLDKVAEQLSVRVSLQHRDIFEAVHRVMPV